MSESMFKNTGITSISFNADRIPASCFEDCTNLESVVINNDIIYVGENAFKNCTSLNSIDIKGESEYIYANAFNNCSNLEVVNLPNSIVKISDSAFVDCIKLHTVRFNEETYIAENVGSIFKNCNELASFEVNSNNSNYSFNGKYLINASGNEIILALLELLMAHLVVLIQLLA